MEMIISPENLPEDEKFHTVEIKDNDDDEHLPEHTVIAHSNDFAVNISAGSIGFGGDGEALGFNHGEATFNAANSMIELQYVEFEEYEYDEIRITFVERDSE